MSENLPPNERPSLSKAPSTSGPMVGGMVLIVLGAFILLQNMGFLWFSNWWALFILAPGLLILYRAWQAYQASGEQFSRHVRTQLLGGIIVTALGVTFLFDINLHRLGLHINWGQYWPVLLILLGAVLLFRRGS